MGAWWWRWELNQGRSELEEVAAAEEWGEGVRKRQRWRWRQFGGCERGGGLEE